MINLQSSRSKQWVVSCRRQDLLNKTTKYLYNNCRLCANHFEDVMFLNFQKNRLKPDAKPTLFDIPNPPAKIGPKRRKLQRTDSLLRRGLHEVSSEGKVSAQGVMGRAK
jgi:hypothetical protein